MRKLAVFTIVGAFVMSIVSCNKCAECSVKENNYYDGEYCKGSTFENIIYEDAKEECNAHGGTFK